MFSKEKGVNMSGIVNFAYQVARNLSLEDEKSSPVIFQRDGIVYFATQRGFTYLNPGADVSSFFDKNRQFQPRDEYSDLIDGTINLFQDGQSSIWRPEDLENFGTDSDYIKALKLPFDSASFTLEQMMELPKKIQNYADNKRVFVLSHDIIDGNPDYDPCSEVQLSGVLSCEEETFLDYLRKKEEKMLNEMERISNIETSYERKKAYENVRTIHAGIVTPYIFAAFPLKRNFKEGKMSWSKKDILRIDRFYQDIYPYIGYPITSAIHRINSSPFTLQIVKNSGIYEITEVLNLCDVSDTKELQKDLLSISANFSEAKNALESIITFYDGIFSENKERKAEERYSGSKKEVVSQEDDLPF